jgi:hypothetical protein
MAKRMTKAEKAARATVEKCFYKVFDRVPVGIFDLSKIYKRGLAAIAEGRDLETEMLARWSGIWDDCRVYRRKT